MTRTKSKAKRTTKAISKSRVKGVATTDEDAIAIGNLCAKAKASMADSIQYMIEAGKKLQTKKDSLNHGEWLPWLKANAGVLGFNNKRTAARLMAVAKRDASASFDETEATQISRSVWGHNVRTIKAPVTYRTERLDVPSTFKVTHLPPTIAKPKEQKPQITPAEPKTYHYKFPDQCSITGLVRVPARDVIGKLAQLKILVAELASDLRHSGDDDLPSSFETEIRTLAKDLLALVQRAMKAIN